jgi:predicted RNA binding protein YcfA (HicA-like mRNA interferase family)
LISSRDLIRALARVGFVHVRTKGSHHMLVRQAPPRTLVVPERREIPRGTLRSILAQAELSDDEFLRLID